MQQWVAPLAAIVMYTFDLSILSKDFAQEKNFYFRLNKVSQNVLDILQILRF
jgi:hypothetical protein